MPTFSPGTNIAMKVPSHEFERTVAFYRDVLGLRVLPDAPQASDINIAFAFGDKTLWIDSVPALSQAEIWLEIRTNDLEAAAGDLAAAGCIRRDEIEPLPDGMAGYWIANPANIIHLLVSED